MHEAKMHEKNCFITLTYNEENLPPDGSLHKEHFQLFMKRLRKKYGEGIKYYHCGEYGEKFSRPHYHACLFGHDFLDKVLFRVDKSGTKLYRSDSLEALWTFGFSTIGEVNFQSAAYVARYVTKKLTGNRPFLYKKPNEKGGYDEIMYQNADEHYEVVNYQTGEVTYRQKEYATMSRRPGIGKTYLEQYKDEIYPRDAIIVKGKQYVPPSYYDKFLEQQNFELYQQIKRRRKANAKILSQQRLEAMEKVKLQTTKILKRHYESQTLHN